MKNRDVASYQKRLNDLFARGEKIADIELQSHWSRYLYVLVSGFLEVSVRAIYSEYARKRSIKTIGRFVGRRLQALQNPNMERILEVTGAFSEEWQERLQKETEGELKDAIDSIVAIRNQVHTAGISESVWEL